MYDTSYTHNILDNQFIQNVKQKTYVDYLIYILLFVIVIYVLLYIKFRITHRFWAIQPVFHIHNLKYWISPPGIIQHGLLPINKYYNPMNIDVFKYSEINSVQEDDIIQLIKNNYLREKDVVYSPTKENITSHFKKHNHACYVAMYNSNNMLIDYKNKKSVIQNKPLSVLTSRPFYVSLYKNNLVTNYVDYLCVDKKYRKKNIAPQTIYTYAVELRKKEHSNITFLFKREHELTLIVPLVTYNSLLYDTFYWSSNVKFPLPYKISRINSGNFPLIIRSFDQIKDKFDCFIHSNINNIQSLVENNTIIPFVIHNGDDVKCIYFYRNPYVSIGDSVVIDLVASVLLDEDFDEFFELGFIKTFLELKRDDANIKFLNIELISHNHMIMKTIRKYQQPISQSPCSYYFYNFAIRPLLHNQVFILG